MSRYTSLFLEAAQVVEKTDLHPGQPFKGAWQTTDGTTWPILIGVIMGNALLEVCRQNGDCVFEHALERLMQVTAGIEIEIKGDPAQYAAHRLRRAAEINQERVETAIERLMRLAGEAAPLLENFAHSSAATDEGRTTMLALAKNIRAALGDARHSGN